MGYKDLYVVVEKNLAHIMRPRSYRTYGKDQIPEKKMNYSRPHKTRINVKIAMIQELLNEGVKAFSS